MPIERDQAIVLRLNDYSETSQIATLFTPRFGRLRVLAKGIRRGTKQRFAVGLDLLERGEVGFAPAHGDSSLGTLADWSQLDSYSGLRRALLRLYAGLYAAEAVALLTEDDDPHPELFTALGQLLAGLAGEDPVPPRIARFQHALLTSIGLAPQLSICVDCGHPQGDATGTYFSSAAGGLVCRDCEMHHVEKRPIDRRLIGGAPGVGDAYAWFELFDYHLRQISGRALRAATQLDTELRRFTRGTQS